MSQRFHILLPTDVFPPHAGGSGWSAHALATALSGRGHRVTAIVPRTGFAGVRRRDERGVPVIEIGYSAPRIPFVQNYYRFELLWPLLRNVIVAEALREHDLPVIIHGQHAQTIPAAVLAGRELNAPVVATIRDAWPWHYFATGLLGDRLPFERRSWATTWLDLIGRLGPIKGVLATPAISYMQRHLDRRARLLAQADAVIACSHYIERKLGSIVPHERLHTIPHVIDVEATIEASGVRRQASGEWDSGAAGQGETRRQGEEEIGRRADQITHHASRITHHMVSNPQPPFLLFVGKLERNKGAHLLPIVLETARDRGADLPPLVIAGTGALRSELERELADRDLPHQFLHGWTDHDEVLRLMREAEVLLFPSAWGEPLSRVLLEGCAVGACIAAMNTGGTSDVIEDGVSGVLVNGAEALGRAVAQLLRDRAERDRLRRGAQDRARTRFAADVVVPQVEALYRSIRQ